MGEALEVAARERRDKAEEREGEWHRPPLRSAPSRQAAAGSECGAGRSRRPDVVLDLPGRYFWDLRGGFGKLHRVRAGKVAGEGGHSLPWQVLLGGRASGRAAPRALALPGGWCVSGSGGSSAPATSCGAAAESGCRPENGCWSSAGGAGSRLGPRSSGGRRGSCPGRPNRWATPGAPSSGTAAGPVSECPRQAEGGCVPSRPVLSCSRPVLSCSRAGWVARILYNCIYGAKAVCASRPAASRLAAQGVRK